MLSIRRKALGVIDSGARALPLPPVEVMQVCRSRDAMPRIPAGKRMLRVLVVDDNWDAADSLSRLVLLWGNDVRTAYDGAAALEMMVTLQPHVVLLDLSMPTMDGCEVARQLRQQPAFANTLLIAITGWADEAHRLLCAEVGFDHYLSSRSNSPTCKSCCVNAAGWPSRPKTWKRRTKPAGTTMSPVKKIPLLAAPRKTKALPCWV